MILSKRNTCEREGKNKRKSPLSQGSKGGGSLLSESGKRRKRHFFFIPSNSESKVENRGGGEKGSGEETAIGNRRGEKETCTIRRKWGGPCTFAC